jgi:cellulase/cellobiase CelA1
MYVDAGHGGWLGWDANLKPGAEELAKVYKNAGSPKQVRGFATNIAGWNAWYVFTLVDTRIRRRGIEEELERLTD